MDLDTFLTEIQDEFNLADCHIDHISDELTEIFDILDSEEGKLRLTELKSRLDQQQQVWLIHSLLLDFF
jgi:hypothetical protein